MLLVDLLKLVKEESIVAKHVANDVKSLHRIFVFQMNIQLDSVS